MKGIKEFIKKNWKKISLWTFIGLFILFFFFYEQIWNCFFENFSKHFFKKPFGYRGELLKVFLTVIMAIVAIAGLVINAMGKKIDTRFNNAVGHLGNANPAVVLGGIHALHQIAVDNKYYTKVVHDLFCSYLRENSEKLYENIDFNKTPNKCPVIIQTLINLLFKPYDGKECIYKEYESDLSFSILKNCDFNEIKIENVSFINCTLENCCFIEAIITNCNFMNATLRTCHFWEGTLNNKHCPLDFHKANLEHCSFDKETLIWCDFENATLIDCRFRNEKTLLEDCQFLEGTLRECLFENITFKNCYFIDTIYNLGKDATLIDCIIEIEDENLINTYDIRLMNQTT